MLIYTRNKAGPVTAYRKKYEGARCAGWVINIDQPNLTQPPNPTDPPNPTNLKVYAPTSAFAPQYAAFLRLRVVVTGVCLPTSKIHSRAGHCNDKQEVSSQCLAALQELGISQTDWAGLMKLAPAVRQLDAENQDMILAFYKFCCWRQRCWGGPTSRQDW